MHKDVDIGHMASTGTLSDPDNLAQDAELGQGDATWLFDIKDVVAPPCIYRDQPDGVTTCDEPDSTIFIKKLSKASKYTGRSHH